MAIRIVFNGVYTACLPGPLDTLTTITQVTPKVYKMEKAVWNNLTHQWNAPAAPKWFENPEGPPNLSIQQKFARIVWTAGACVATALQIPDLYIKFFHKPVPILTIRGISCPVNVLLAGMTWTSLVLAWTAVKEFTPKDQLSLLHSQIAWARFKKIVSLCAAVAFTVITSVGIYLLTKNYKLTFQGTAYPLTFMTLLGGSTLASIVAVKSFDKQSRECNSRTEDLARWVNCKFENLLYNSLPRRLRVDAAGL